MYMSVNTDCSKPLTPYFHLTAYFLGYPTLTRSFTVNLHETELVHIQIIHSQYTACHRQSNGLDLTWANRSFLGECKANEMDNVFLGRCYYRSGLVLSA